MNGTLQKTIEPAASHDRQQGAGPVAHVVVVKLKPAGTLDGKIVATGLIGARMFLQA